MGRQDAKTIDQLELTKYSALEYLGVNGWHHRQRNLAEGKTSFLASRKTHVIVQSGLLLGIVGTLAWSLLSRQFLGLILPAIGIGFWFVWARLRKNSLPTEEDMQFASDLDRLFKRIEQHNRLVDRIRMLDRLEEVGNDVDLGNREKAVEVLRENRESYIKGLKTVRILAENSGATTQLCDLQSILEMPPLAVESEAKDYAAIVDASIGGHVRVRESMS